MNEEENINNLNTPDKEIVVDNSKFTLGGNQIDSHNQEILSFNKETENQLTNQEHERDEDDINISDKNEDNQDYNQEDDSIQIKNQENLIIEERQESEENEDDSRGNEDSSKNEDFKRFNKNLDFEFMGQNRESIHPNELRENLDPKAKKNFKINNTNNFEVKGNQERKNNFDEYFRGNNNNSQIPFNTYFYPNNQYGGTPFDLNQMNIFMNLMRNQFMNMNNSPFNMFQSFNPMNMNTPLNNTPVPPISLELQNKAFQMKINMIKLETENKALKEKIIDLNSIITNLQSESNKKTEILHPRIEYVNESDNKEKDSVIKNLRNMIENKTKDQKEKEIQMKEFEQNLTEKLEKSGKELESVNKEIKKKDDLIKKLAEENENLRRIIENLKRDNTSLKSTKTRLENENYILLEKQNELEKVKANLEKRRQLDENQIKSLISDYDNLMKQSQQSKKLNESLHDKISDFTAENHNLKQEIIILKKKINSQNTKIDEINQDLLQVRMEMQRKKENEKHFKTNTQNTRNYESINDNEIERGNSKGRRPKDNPYIEESKFQEKYDEDEEEEEIQNRREIRKRNKPNNRSKSRESNPGKRIVTESDYINSHARTELYSIDLKLSELMSEKTKLSNELFKMPEKQKTLVLINKRKALETQIKNIEKDITTLRLKLRELTSQTK